MTIVQKLSLNKHPKDNINLSLVNAHNVKVSHDESCIMNEESIRENTFIKSYLNTYYGTGVQYKIVGIIPCNNELVLIVKPSNVIDLADIFRYREGNETVAESMYCAYGGKASSNRFSYLGGKIRGTFTYNVESSLIVAIVEYGINNRVPLRTINLGNFDNSSIYNDRDVPNGLLSIAPEVRLPDVSNLNYVEGSSYKGWYYLFIRYKINSVDYSQWHSIGFPIYIDSLEQYQIIRYCYNRDTRIPSDPVMNIAMPKNPDDGYGAGFSDYLSNTTDIAKEAFDVDILFDNDISYNRFQIGVICSSKSYIKSFRTSDINFDEGFINTPNGKLYKYTLDNKNLIEHSSEDLITDNYNYFNAEQVINYQNRLYISNYQEDNNNKKIDSNIINNITVGLEVKPAREYGFVYDITIVNKNNIIYTDQYYANNLTSDIPLSSYMGVPKETRVVVTDGSLTITGRADRFFIAMTGYINYAFIEHRTIIDDFNYTSAFFGKDSEKTVKITIVDDANIHKDNNVIEFNTRNNVIIRRMNYYNNELSFDNRKKASSLIPGEVYNFFIHYVDKYGHSTNGHRINNNTRWATEDNVNRDIVPITISPILGSFPVTIYAALNINDNIVNVDSNGNHTINTTGITFYRGYTELNNAPKLTNKVTSAEHTICLNYFLEFVSSYRDSKFLDYKWYQIGYFNSVKSFQPYINDNGERLFKVPMSKIFGGGSTNTNEEIYSDYNILKANFNNIVIPEEYEGYFISYEKFESLRRHTGILTRNDFRSQDYINKWDGTNQGLSVLLPTANSFKSDKMYFYSSQYDIADSIKLDYNIIRMEGVNVFKEDDISTWDYMQRNYAFNFVHDCNKPLYNEGYNDTFRTYAMPEYKLAIADSAVDNRMGLGTALEIKDSYSLFPNYEPKHGDNRLTKDNSRINIYKVTLLNNTRNIYMSNNKTLVRLSNVKYRNRGDAINKVYNSGTIESGYNGNYSIDGVIVYENSGVSFNTTTNKVTRLVQDTEYYPSEIPVDTPHTYQNDIPFVAYFQFPVCSEIFFESKSFKAPPQPVVYLVKSANDKNKYYTGSMVTPANSIDLFENRQGSSDNFNPKTYTNYREDLVSVDIYGKTIRRSNVIQDETRANGWRRFPIEGYKSISENKGNITNLVGIGVVLLVHTEHSLFIFDTDNTLRTEGRDIQLSQPDAFEVRYKEVFTSDLGFGGLQDSKSYIIDQFGYIFYSRDTNRIYHFDNNQLGNMDDDIIEWLHKYKPFNVRFANDKYNNRILIKMDYIINSVSKSIVLSYNYNTKTFITQHTYYFDEAYSTKTGLYLHCDNEHTGCTLHQFVDKESSYGSYDNIKGSIGVPTIQKSKLSFIVNERFNNVKFLEYITYKLTKYINDTNIDFTNSPVEEYMEPFSGNIITVYNNMVNTGVLDIKVDNESDKNVFAQFDKPYWDLGVWNFSYLRNNIDKLNNGVSAGDMSRVFGNYFIIEFEFNNEDGRRIEFEELGYELSKD